MKKDISQRFIEFSEILKDSKLTMTHDVVGEVSEDVTAALKEKARLTLLITYSCLSNELEGYLETRLKRLLFRKRIMYVLLPQMESIRELYNEKYATE